MSRNQQDFLAKWQLDSPHSKSGSLTHWAYKLSWERGVNPNRFTRTESVMKAYIVLIESTQNLFWPARTLRQNNNVNIVLTDSPV